MRRGSVGLVSVVLLGFVACVLSANMMGGVSTVQDTETPEIQEAANKALSLLNQQPDMLGGTANGMLTLNKIKTVKRQVVAGFNYFFELEVSDAKGEAHTVSLTMWARPWLEGRNGEEPAYKLTRAELVQ